MLKAGLEVAGANAWLLLPRGTMAPRAFAMLRLSLEGGIPVREHFVQIEGSKE